jgi:hypothetical protein
VCDRDTQQRVVPEIFAVCKCALPVTHGAVEFHPVMSFEGDIAAGLLSVRSAAFAPLFRACESARRTYTESAEHFAAPE